jgi:Protein of unknown function (DUF1295)
VSLHVVESWCLHLHHFYFALSISKFSPTLFLTMAALPGVPAIKVLSDCADFLTTAQPYLAQLQALPLALYQASTTSTQALLNLYSDTNPVLLAFAFSLFAGVIFLLVSEINKNYSQVDRMWSVLPFVYVLHYDVWARQNGIPNARNDLATLCIAVWGSRLTFNYWRRGGYSIGSEDYRWAIVKQKIGGFGMFVLNVTFIATVQSVSHSFECKA